MSIPAHLFQPFPRLPKELREQIWSYCLPYRVCESNIPNCEVIYDAYGADAVKPCFLGHTTYMNRRPPLISRICHESRTVAFNSAKVRHEVGFFEGLPSPWWDGGDGGSDAWEDPTRDSYHFNWNQAFVITYEPQGSPLDDLVWYASRYFGGASLTMHYFDARMGYREVYYDSDEDVTYPLNDTQSRDLAALMQQPSWQVVMRIVVVHSDLRTAVATGLFGLLGDERVQIVEASDETSVKAFLDLAEACERKASVTIGQDFSQEPVDVMKERLRKVAMAAFNSENVLAIMRPAIMFRLCTKFCNHRVGEGKASS